MMYFETNSQPGWALNFTLAHVLFWLYGFPDLSEYGYSNTFSEQGNIPSGPLGSGGGIVTLLIVCVMSLVWLQKLVSHEYGKKEDIGMADQDDDYD